MDEKKFDSERDELSPEEVQALEIFVKVEKHELTAFGGLMEMIKLVEASEKEETPSLEEVPS